MISVRIGSHRFHYRAAAVVRESGHLLLHRLDGDGFWALPGGRVNVGEQAQEAVKREFIEELNLPVECGPLICIGENFFEYEGEPHHEIGLYFAAKLQDGSALLDQSRVHFGVETGRRLVFKWFPFIELPNIDMRPVALQAAISRGNIPLHFVQSSNAA